MCQEFGLECGSAERAVAVRWTDCEVLVRPPRYTVQARGISVRWRGSTIGLAHCAPCPTVASCLLCPQYD